MNKSKSKRPKSVRVSTSLPQLMVESFKEKAEISGVSVSRLIYLQLKTRKPIIIVPGELRQEVRKLRQLLNKIIVTGKIESEAVELLRRQVQMHEAIVDSNHGGDVYVS